jgi:hypothetical protein
MIWRESRRTLIARAVGRSGGTTPTVAWTDEVGSWGLEEDVTVRMVTEKLQQSLDC